MKQASHWDISVLASESYGAVSVARRCMFLCFRRGGILTVGCFQNLALTGLCNTTNPNLNSPCYFECKKKRYKLEYWTA